MDFQRLRRVADAGAFFVIRERADVRYYGVLISPRRSQHEPSIRPIDSVQQQIRARNCPDLMRRVSIFDMEESRRMAFWTNQWTLSAATTAEFYSKRWQIELFLRWTKQTLRIRAF